MTFGEPYRGAMPEPRLHALRVAGHVVRAESLDELQTGLRLLGAAVGFVVYETEDEITLRRADGELVEIEEVFALPN